jgi:hypothetical protein
MSISASVRLLLIYHTILELFAIGPALATLVHACAVFKTFSSLFEVRRQSLLYAPVLALHRIPVSTTLSYPSKSLANVDMDVVHSEVGSPFIMKAVKGLVRQLVLTLE